MGLMRSALVLVATLAVAGCTSTGNSFNTRALHQLVPGQTTLDETIAVLGADPVNTYRQLDGSATSIWSHKNSMLTDAIYLNQELWLAFGPDGRFQRVLKKHNLPISSDSGYQSPTAVQTISASASASAPMPPLALTPSSVPGATIPTPAVAPSSAMNSVATPAPAAGSMNANPAVVSYPIAN